MAKNELINSIEQFADKLESLANQYTDYEIYFDKKTPLKRNFTATLTGPLPPAEVEELLDDIEESRPVRFRQLKTQYQGLINIAKDIEKLIVEASPASIEKAQKLFGDLRFRSFRLVNTFRHTAVDLKNSGKSKTNITD